MPGSAPFLPGSMASCACGRSLAAGPGPFSQASGLPQRKCSYPQLTDRRAQWLGSDARTWASQLLVSAIHQALSILGRQQCLAASAPPSARAQVPTQTQQLQTGNGQWPQWDCVSVIKNRVHSNALQPVTLGTVAGFCPQFLVSSVQARLAAPQGAGRPTGDAQVFSFLAAEGLSCFGCCACPEEHRRQGQWVWDHGASLDLSISICETEIRCLLALTRY